MADGKLTSMHDLIQSCRRGEEKAWRELLNRISPTVFSVCRDKRLSQEETLDVFGQVCFLMVKNIDQIRDSSRVFSYVGTIARRQIYDRFYRDRGLEFIDASTLDENSQSLDDSPEGEYEAASRKSKLLEAFATLSLREQGVLRALFFDEKEPTYEQIALQLNMPVASIGPTRARALKKLERKLRQMGYKFDVF